jgi:hypothetical protein
MAKKKADPLIPIPQSIVLKNCANKNNTVSRLNLKDEIKKANFFLF